MKALAYDAYGSLDVLKLGDLPDPQPGPKEVLVEVKAASLNAVDWKIRSGGMKLFSGSHFPKVPGMDFAGTIKALGPNVTGFEVGNAVYGIAGVFGRKPGTCAERVVAEAKMIRLMPEFLTFPQAAALPVAALTALNGLRKCGSLQGQSVAVIGATGGVGHFAVQIAKAGGAKVTGICRAGNLDLAKKLGAEEVIDYRKQDFTKAGQKYDIIFDTHAHEGFAHFKPALNPRGFYAATLPSVSFLLQLVWQIVAGGPKAVLAEMKSTPGLYDELEALLKSGAVKPLLEQKFTLTEWRKAFELLESGKVRGKVVMEV
jgi:NADPH:quinone reductase-like Zn-dependent oxidoreductase